MPDVLDILNKLPQHAFVDNRRSDGSLVVPDCQAPVINVVRGREGYSPIHTPLTADELNAGIGVTPAQREALLHGSMFGFHTKGADLDNYAQDGSLLHVAAA